MKREVGPGCCPYRGLPQQAHKKTGVRCPRCDKEWILEWSRDPSSWWIEGCIGPVKRGKLNVR